MASGIRIFCVRYELLWLLVVVTCVRYSVVIGCRVSCVRYSVVIGSRVTCIRYEILWLLVVESPVYAMKFCGYWQSSYLCTRCNSVACGNRVTAVCGLFFFFFLDECFDQRIRFPWRPFSIMPPGAPTTV